MLDNIAAVKEANEDGRLKVGTVDCWLIYKLTGGASGGKHLTDVTNASRTNLFNIQKCKWDSELCECVIDLLFRPMPSAILLNNFSSLFTGLSVLILPSYLP